MNKNINKINFYLLQRDEINKLEQKNINVKFSKNLWSILDLNNLNLLNNIYWNLIIRKHVDYFSFLFEIIWKIVYGVFLIFLWYILYKQLNAFNINKDDVIEIEPWNFDLELVEYWWNKNLIDLLDEIKKLNEKWKINEFLSWILMYWPPWTWKTLFWKYLAKELNLSFFYVSSNNLKSSYYWWTWQKIKKFFDMVRKKVKSKWYNWAIIFIDELDSIWMNRNYSHEATSEWLNTLLTEIDWMKDNNFIVIWATNRKEVLDEALLSRFNYKLLVNLPNIDERKEIILNQLANKILKLIK